MILAYLFAAMVFLLIYLGIYRPLFPCREPGNIGDVIAVVQNVKLQELERLLSDEMSSLLLRDLTPAEQRRAQRERRRAISARLEPLTTNVRLCLAFTRRKAIELRGIDPGTYTERQWLLQHAFQKAQSCSLLLAFAKATRLLMPWDVKKFVRFHRETVIHEIREVMVLFVKLSETYGEHHRENLLAALDAWELVDESI